MKKKFKITYNAPVTLTLTIACAVILALDKYAASEKLIPALFMVPGNHAAAVSFNWTNPLDYIRLFTHIFGHTDWLHFLSNFSFILILGPLMEEKYGSAAVILMMSVTALVTGVINVAFMPSSLLGASGIAFMLILLSAASTVNKNEFPLSFLFLVAVYVTHAFLSPADTGISTVAHITGGLCGSLFGFLTPSKVQRTSAKKSTDKTSSGKKQSVQTEKEKASEDYKNGGSQTDSGKTVEIGTLKF